MIFREKRLLVSKPDEVTRIDGILIKHLDKSMFLKNKVKMLI